MHSRSIDANTMPTINGLINLIRRLNFCGSLVFIV